MRETEWKQYGQHRTLHSFFFHGSSTRTLLHCDFGRLKMKKNSDSAHSSKHVKRKTGFQRMGTKKTNGRFFCFFFSLFATQRVLYGQKKKKTTTEKATVFHTVKDISQLYQAEVSLSTSSQRLRFESITRSVYRATSAHHSIPSESRRDIIDVVIRFDIRR